MWVWGGRRRVNLGEEVWLEICLVSFETKESEKRKDCG
jgi:hypothetical protein